MTRRRPVLLVAAFALLLPRLAAHAAAQEAVLRPFQGLFGGGEPSPTGVQALDFIGSIYGGYDDNVSQQVGGRVDPRLQVPSWLAGASAGLTYSRRLSRRASLGASVFTNGAYLFDLDEVSWYGTNAAVGFATAVGRRGQFRVGQSVGYRPYYQFGVLPTEPEPDLSGGVTVPVGSEYLLAGLPSWNYYTSVGYSHQIARRLSLDTSYSFRFHDYMESEVSDLRDQVAGARLSYRLTSFLSARAGYYYRYHEYLDPLGEDQTDSDHYIDAGLGLNKDWRFGWALGPKTTFSVGFGTNFTTAVRDDDLRVAFNLVGDAQFAHWFNDRWQFQSGYDRRVRFLDGITEPWITDVFFASLGGYVNARVNLSAYTGYALGNQVGGRGAYDTWTNAARLQVALTTTMAMFAQYFYYHYVYTETALPEGLPTEFDRQGVRVGLTFRVPLLR